MMIELSREKSKRVYEASKEVIAGGVNSPVRAFLALEMMPIVVERGEGAYLTDVDGNCYIDYCMSWGASILGHASKHVLGKVMEQAKKGFGFGTITPTEEALAKKILAHFPHIDQLRFVSSGTEATMTALRLARGYTGRKTIIKFNGHYHGHSDSLLVKAGSGVHFVGQASSKGIPEEFTQYTISLPFNDGAAFIKAMQSMEVAAVILEPVCGNSGAIAASEEFIDLLKRETKKRGTILIFDEVITGFRLGLAGAQGFYGVQADLTCFGKIIGGGFPAAAFGGKKEIMAHLAPLGGVYQGGTLSGNPIAMTAGIATLSELEKPYFYEDLEAKVAFLLDPIEEMIRQKAINATINRVGCMFSIFFGLTSVKSPDDLPGKIDLQKFKEFFAFLFNRGVYPPPSAYEAWFISSAHTYEDLAITRDLILEFFEKQ